MEDKKNFELFGGKTLSDLFKDIYDNSSSTRNQIDNLITELKPFIKSLSDAAVIIPLMKEYLEVGVKNDEMKVKLADIIQKLLRSEKTSSNNELTLLSDDEKDQLSQEVMDYETYSKLEDVKLKNIGKRADTIKKHLEDKIEEKE